MNKGLHVFGGRWAGISELRGNDANCGPIRAYIE
jgi:hypothetical protein